MSDLEEMGYIIQPHTSAGRIPSDKGYRLYVDELIKSKDQEVADMKEMMIKKTDKLEKMLANIPMHRMATPQDIAGVVMFLVSDESQYVTGITVDATGGRYIYNN